MREENFTWDGSLLGSQSEQILLRWWDTLVSYPNPIRWPEDLPLKPEGWEEMPSYPPENRSPLVVGDCRWDYSLPIVRAIVKRVGLKACARYLRERGSTELANQLEGRSG